MRVAIDTGGTFTDCVYLAGGELRVLKVFSTPANPAQAVLDGLARIGAGKATRCASRHHSGNQHHVGADRSAGRICDHSGFRGHDRHWAADTKQTLRLVRTVAGMPGHPNPAFWRTRAGECGGRNPSFSDGRRAKHSGQPGARERRRGDSHLAALFICESGDGAARGRSSKLPRSPDLRVPPHPPRVSRIRAGIDDCSQCLPGAPDAELSAAVWSKA